MRGAVLAGLLGAAAIASTAAGTPPGSLRPGTVEAPVVCRASPDETDALDRFAALIQRLGEGSAKPPG